MNRIADNELLNRITNICASLTVFSLPKRFYNEVKIDWQMNPITDVEPVCLATPLLSQQYNNSFEIYNFYNWLYSGFRIVPDEPRMRFELFKGIGLTVPEAYKDVQRIIQDVYKYRLIPNADSPDSPFKVLQVDSESGNRVGGAEDIPYLIPDVQGYGWLHDDTSIHLPEVRKFITFTDEFCELVSIPSATYGQNIRRFANPFRITDLQLMILLSTNADSKYMYSQWLKKAEAVVSLSSELAGYNNNYHGYIAYISKMIGRIAASLIRNRIWHRLLTGHCQNMTLGGELTEFSYAAKIPSHGESFSVNTPHFGLSSYDVAGAESRLYSQVLLLANHVRHFVNCMRWIGIEVTDDDSIFFFVQGMKDTLPEQQVKALLYHFDTDPYCFDTNHFVQSRFSTDNLKDCDSFIKKLHRIVYEELR